MDQHTIQPEISRIPEILNTNSHAKMASGGLVVIRAEQAIPPRQVEAEVACQIDLPLLPPVVSDAHDACVHRLTERLLARPGMERVHLITARGEAPAHLCIHYDADILSLARIERLARQTGAQIGTRYGHVVWPLAGRSDQRAARTLADRLITVPKTRCRRAELPLNQGNVIVTFRPGALSSSSMVAS